MKKNFIRFSLFSLFLVAAKMALAVHSDVPPYCSDPRYDSSEVSNSKGSYADPPLDQKKAYQFKIFYPSKKVDTSSSRAFILYLHGGGFSSGSYTQETNRCKEFAERGFVAVSINYFTSQWQTAGCNSADTSQLFTNIYKAVQDAHAAMRYFCFHAADYKIDTSRMFIGGSSAGSIIALFTAFLDQNEANADLGMHTNLGGLDGAINAIQIHYTLKGVTDESGAVRYATDIDVNEKIPVVSFHATGDPLVPYGANNFFWKSCGNAFPVVNGSSIIYSRLAGFGICAELNYDSSSNHGGFTDDYVVRHTSCFFHSTWIHTCQTQQFNYKFNILPDCCSGHRGESFDQPPNSWIAFPNPASDEIRFNLPEEANSVYTIQIFSAEGFNLLEFSYAEGNEAKLSTIDFPQGIYFYSIKNKNQRMFNGSFAVIH